MDLQTREKSIALFDDVNELLYDMWWRWQDEKDYEDINDYSVPLMKYIDKHNAKLLKMTEHPFGFKILLGGITLQYYANHHTCGVEACMP